jgi:type IV pilus assembly protein PilB
LGESSFGNAPQDVVAFLAATAVFNSCPPEYLAKLAPLVERAVFAQGQMILAPGASVETLNLLARGRASLQFVDATSGERTVLDEIFPGDTFGEVGLVLGSPNPAAVVAEEACEVCIVRGAHFEKILQAAPQVSKALMRRIATRFVRASMITAKRTGTAGRDPTHAGGLASPVTGGKFVAFVETAQFALNAKLLELLPTRMILEQRLLPLEVRGRSLIVGMVNPTSVAAKDELRRTLVNMDPEIVAISADDFAQTVVRMKIDVRERPTALAATSRALKPTYQVEIKKESEKQLHVGGDDVVNLLDRILLDAIERGVSDVHIEPDTTGVRVRYRVQGMLQDRKETIPASYAAPLVARTKVLAELDITDRRFPQDGRIVMQVGTRELNVRVSTLPVARGEKVVLRLLDPSDVMRPLEHIFLDAPTLERVMRGLSASHGAIVVAGATGSGKSSTQYSLLNQRRKLRPDNSIVTVEDPIEFLLPGITQAPVSARAGMEYPVALRALMRQDPDVIMIGELRDAATATVLVEAALTGHLLLATMHGSNTPAVFQRLEHFGCESLQLAQALNLVIVQKLARRLCSACVREDTVAPQLLESLVARNLMAKGGGTRFPKPGGCEACAMTGYRGRAAVVELLAIEDGVRDALTAGEPLAHVIARAEETGNYISFAQSARMLMARRAISPADALSVTS